MADRAAGLLLVAVSVLPYLALRAARGALPAPTFAWRGTGPAPEIRVRLLASAAGRPRRLWWQAPLGRDLLRGRASVSSSEAGASVTLEFWNDLMFAPERFGAPGQGLDAVVD